MFFLSLELQAEDFIIILSFTFLSFSAFTEKKGATLHFNSICIHLPKYYKFWRNMMKYQCIWKPPSTIERWRIFCNQLTPRSSWLQIHGDTQNNCNKTVTLCVSFVSERHHKLFIIKRKGGCTINILYCQPSKLRPFWSPWCLEFWSWRFDL